MRGWTYVPGWSAKVGLGSVVVTLTVAAEEEHLVLDILARLRVQLLDLVVEALPLSEVLALVLEHLVGRVGTVDEAKVYTPQSMDGQIMKFEFEVQPPGPITYVVKGRRVRGGLILQEIPRHGRVLD